MQRSASKGNTGVQQSLENQLQLDIEREARQRQTPRLPAG